MEWDGRRTGTDRQQMNEGSEMTRGGVRTGSGGKETAGNRLTVNKSNRGTEKASGQLVGYGRAVDIWKENESRKKEKTDEKQ